VWPEPGDEEWDEPVGGPLESPCDGASVGWDDDDGREPPLEGAADGLVAVLEGPATGREGC
jgi:hypothetical protein